MNVLFISQGTNYDVENAGHYVQAPRMDFVAKHERINLIDDSTVVILYSSRRQSIYGVGFFERDEYVNDAFGTPCRRVYLDRVVFEPAIPKRSVSARLYEYQLANGLNNAPFYQNGNGQINVNLGYCFYACKEMLEIIMSACGERDRRMVNEKIEQYHCGTPLHNFDDEDHYLESHITRGTTPQAVLRTEWTEGVFEYKGVVYPTITIGGKTWMADNFACECDGAKYANGRAETEEDYGRLYTWKSAIDNCPEGWHLPTDDEWKKFFKDSRSEEAALSLDDYYGFAVPMAGCVMPNGKSVSFREVCVFWSASEKKANEASRWSMSEKTHKFSQFFMDKQYAFSIRYVKDDE